MAICRIKQEEIFSSGVFNDSLDPTNAPTSANLEEDLNYIRSVLRSFFGTSNWYDVPSGNITEILNAFPVEHYADTGEHSDVTADSIYVMGGGVSIDDSDLDIGNGALTITEGTDFSVQLDGADVSFDADAYYITAQNGNVQVDFKTSGSTFSVLEDTTERLSIQDSGLVSFFAAPSSGTKLIDFGSGYSLYVDNEGPLGQANGTRLWIDGPNGDPDASGIILGPRTGADRLATIRLRARETRIEGNGGPRTFHVITNINSSTRHPLAWMETADNQGFVIYVDGQRKVISPLNSNSYGDTYALSFDANNNNWEVTTSQYLQVHSSSGYIRIGAYNSTYAHFYTDRSRYYFNTDVAIDGSLIFYGLTASKQYRIYVGSSFPGTPQDGDIWFKVS